MRKDTVVAGWDQEEFIADVSHYSHISYEFLYKTTILRNLPVIPLNEKIWFIAQVFLLKSLFF